MARWPPFPAASFAALLLLASASCGTEPEPEPTFADIPVGTPFATTPAPVRERSALGEVAPVPELVAYLGYFRRDPILPRSTGAPCETVPYHLAPFEAQVYPWTYGDLRRCVAEGVCPNGLVDDSPPRQDDDIYVEVEADAATKLCRLHGGEVITNAQLVALAQGGQRRVAWESFESDVLSRCAVEGRRTVCTPYEVPSDRTVRRKASEPREARGPYGHYGLLGTLSLVRQFPDGYRVEYRRDGCSGSALPAAIESGTERMARVNGYVAALTLPPDPAAIWEVSAFPVDRIAPTDRKTGRVRCAFPAKTK